MTAELPCPHCAAAFFPNRSQRVLLLDSRQKGMRLLMLRCRLEGPEARDHIHGQLTAEVERDSFAPAEL